MLSHHHVSLTHTNKSSDIWKWKDQVKRNKWVPDNYAFLIYNHWVITIQIHNAQVRFCNLEWNCNKYTKICCCLNVEHKTMCWKWPAVENGRQLNCIVIGCGLAHNDSRSILVQAIVPYVQSGSVGCITWAQVLVRVGELQAFERELWDSRVYGLGLSRDLPLS
jgi:hypothetical protein